MKIDGSSVRNFLANYTDIRTSEVDLDQLVIEYRNTLDSKTFATIYNKILGTILKFGRNCPPDLGVDEDDICSYGMATLFRALDPIKGWKNDNKVKFVTYFYRAIYNEILTICNKKCNREYKQYTVSLDELLRGGEEDDDSCVKFQPTEQDTCFRYIQGRKETLKDSINILCTQVADTEILSKLAFELGVSKVGLKIASLAAKVKISSASEEEKLLFNQNKKLFKETRKQLKFLV